MSDLAALLVSEAALVAALASNTTRVSDGGVMVEYRDAAGVLAALAEIRRLRVLAQAAQPSARPRMRVIYSPGDKYL